MRIDLGPLDSFPADTPTPVSVDGTSYLVLRQSQTDGVCVVLDKCPHAGLSLSKGPRGGYNDGVITCPWHNSAFEVCGGQNLDWTPGFAGIKAPRWSRKVIAMGKQPAPLTTFEASVSDGRVIIHA